MTVQNEHEEYQMGHMVRTAAIWKRLLELGSDERSPLDFDFSFTAKRKQDAEALREALSDYVLESSSEGILRKTFTLTGSSSPISWTEEQLLEWVDYLISIGRDTNCEFQGCGATAP